MSQLCDWSWENVPPKTLTVFIFLRFLSSLSSRVSPWFSSKISCWVFQYFLFDFGLCHDFFFMLWRDSELDIAEKKTGPSYITSGSQTISLLGAVRWHGGTSSLLTVALHLYDWKRVFHLCQVYPDFLNTDFSNCSRYFEIVLCIWFWRIPLYLQKTQQIFHSVTAWLFSMFLPSYV